MRPLDVVAARRHFPGLLRRAGDLPTVFCDGPAGSQVPLGVVEAMRRYLLFDNANHGGDFATSRATDAMVAAARATVATFVGGEDAEEIVFGANMTTLTGHFARALARTWRRGDAVVVTDSDHDANVTPWTIVARDAGCEVRRIPVRPDASLDLAAAERLIDARTRLVAVGAASNLSGTIHPVAEVCALARRHGAVSFVDAVHLAPHLRLAVRRSGCDALVCSAYKFFGPHAGILWARRALLESLTADKVRPAADHGAEKWQTGTANFEAIAGTQAAIAYLAALGRTHGAADADLATALDDAFAVIARHERDLCARLLAGLAELPGVRIVGIAEPARVAERCPTVSFTHERWRPQPLARALAERHINCWAGNSYALALTTALGLEPDGVLRLGLLHYNTAEEIDLVLAELRGLLRRPPA